MKQCVCCQCIPVATCKTETDEVARCTRCGMPYYVNSLREIMYPSEGPMWIGIAQSYYEKTQKIVFPCDHNILYINYSGVGFRDATETEISSWNNYIMEELDDK